MTKTDTLSDARRQIADVELARYIEHVVSKAPRLTGAQRDHLASLLGTPRRIAGGDVG